MEIFHILRDISKKSLMEFFFWSILSFFIFPFLLLVKLHHYIEEVTKLLNLPSIQIKQGLMVGIGHLFAFGLIEVFLYMLMARIHGLHILIWRRSKGTDEIKQSIKSIVYHLLEESTACNLYGNVLLAKLVGCHQPRKWEQTGNSFWLIRHERDFELPPSISSPRPPCQQLIDIQIDDFHTIQQCIKKSWNTVAYGDIAVLLEKPEYISYNIKMIRKKVQKRKVRRLFVYPYYNEISMVNFIHTELESLTLNEADVQAMILVSPATNFPETRVDIIKLNITGISNGAARAIRDVIYLVWLVKLHEHFGIDYRIVSRHATLDAANIDIIGTHLLNSWKDEGSALIDDQVIVRFDDKMETNGVIYYEFIKAPDDRLMNYKKTFDTVWSPAMPKSYTLEERHPNEVVISSSLRDFLSIFFNDTTCDVLLDIPADKWIEIIKNELMKK